MRTTLTIDDSIAQRLKYAALKSGLPFKTVVNMTLENGLRNLNEKNKVSEVSLKTFKMGFPPRANLDKALQAASTLEDDEIIRKLETHK